MKSKFTDEEKESILKRYLSKCESPTSIVKSVEISKSTFYKWLSGYQQEQSESKRLMIIWNLTTNAVLMPRSNTRLLIKKSVNIQQYSRILLMSNRSMGVRISMVSSLPKGALRLNLTPMWRKVAIALLVHCTTLVFNEPPRSNFACLAGKRAFRLGYAALSAPSFALRTAT